MYKEDLLIFNIVESLTKDGRVYLKFIFVDKRSNKIAGIMFDTNGIENKLNKGDIVTVEGLMQNYNGQNQLKVNMIEPSSISEDEKKAFIPRSVYNPNDMITELFDLLDKYIKTPQLREVIDQLKQDKDIVSAFMDAPAAKNFHHAYVSGLLEHTLSVCKLCVKVVELYGEQLNIEHMLIGALFHDIGKIQELNANDDFDYTDAGKLIGHIYIGTALLEKYINNIPKFPKPLRNVLMHIVLSHHGSLEFGSPVVPKTAEALAVNFIDDFDAKFNAIKYIIKNSETEIGGWSSYDKLMLRQFYNHGMSDILKDFDS